MGLEKLEWERKPPTVGIKNMKGEELGSREQG